MVYKGPNKALSEAANACASVLAYLLAAAFPLAAVAANLALATNSSTVAWVYTSTDYTLTIKITKRIRGSFAFFFMYRISFL